MKILGFETRPPTPCEIECRGETSLASVQNISRTGAAIITNSPVQASDVLVFSVEGHQAIRARVIGNESGIVRIQFDERENAAISWAKSSRTPDPTIMR